MIIELIRRTVNFLLLQQAKMRGRLYGLFIKQMGRDVQIMHGVRILDPRNVSIGDCCYVNHNTDIYGQGGVHIGNYVLIGQNCNIMSVNHAFSDWKRPIALQGITTGPIVIEDDVWIGGNVTVLPNVRIKRGAIIGANSVVTKDVAALSIVGGSPAKFIRSRFSSEIQEKAAKLKFTKEFC